jgi:hypothetical protein
VIFGKREFERKDRVALGVRLARNGTIEDFLNFASKMLLLDEFWIEKH